MLHQIASLALASLISTFGIVAHHHCPENYSDPLCVPKGAIPHVIDGGLSGAVEELVADRGSGRVDPNQPPAGQG